MSASELQRLIEITIASSIAIVLVCFLRKGLRRVAGARIAYWLWLCVPANVCAVWLPVAPSSQTLSHAISNPLTGAIPHSLVTGAVTGNPDIVAPTLLFIWLSGVLVIAVWLFVRQRTFLRSLGSMYPAADGVLRSERTHAPMLVGAWRPLVVVPADFERRYCAEDRALMLAHEHAHRARGDAVANLIAIAWLCVFWFNPLMYWGLAQFRLDQELACDEHVLARAAFTKNRYANALLKAQLSSESIWRLPAGCHWQSSHPLKERIQMLKRPSPGLSRHLGGIAATVVLTAASMFAVSSSFAQAPAESASAAAHSAKSTAAAERRFSIDFKDINTRDVLAMIARKGNTNVLVSDQVNGKITVHLKDVTWRQALDIVAMSQGLVTRQSGDITLVGVPH